MSARAILPLGLLVAVGGVLAMPGAACVPTGSAPPYDAGAAPQPTVVFRSSVNIMTAPFEDSFDRPDAAAEPVGAAGAKDGGPAEAGAEEAEAGADAGEAGAAAARAPADRLGPNWTSTRPGAWKIEKGMLCGEGAKNHGVWLNRTLPVNARIEFDAIAYSEDGDLKAEVWGDGKSFATGTSYTNATSYLAILGGWHNSIHALARLNEHGTDRKEIHVDKDSDDPRQRAVVRGQLYQFKIERTDGKTIRVTVNGADYFSWTDPSPLAGQGHDHLGFNEWEAKVCFDNVKVTPL